MVILLTTAADFNSFLLRAEFLAGFVLLGILAKLEPLNLILK